MGGGPEGVGRRPGWGWEEAGTGPRGGGEGPGGLQERSGSAPKREEAAEEAAKPISSKTNGVGNDLQPPYYTIGFVEDNNRLETGRVALRSSFWHSWRRSGTPGALVRPFERFCSPTHRGDGGAAGGNRREFDCPGGARQAPQGGGSRPRVGRGTRRREANKTGRPGSLHSL